MINNDKRLLELYNLLISGEYLQYDTVSFLNFIKILRLINCCRKFSNCVKKSHIALSSFLGILEFLQNVNIIKLQKNSQIQIQNNEIFDLIYHSPSHKRIFFKLVRKIPRKYYFIRKQHFLSKSSLLKLFRPNFKLNPLSFQLPCSVRTSINRAQLILENVQFKTQKALFIGDDDLISILCKYIIPELPITIIEIDGRITKLLKEIAEKMRFKNFGVYNLDFKDLKEEPDLLKEKYSIIHLDPPYEETELKDFLNIIGEILDDKIIQIFLNGLYDDNSQAIINQFVSKNNLNISKYYKSFNSYPFKSLDSKILKYFKKEIKIDNKMKFREKNLKRLEVTSDLLLIEKGWIGDTQSFSTNLKKER
ncbi:MAG: bis-aminopropyl spermidine synthase family protein [Promethearchaeota archaeon]